MTLDNDENTNKTTYDNENLELIFFASNEIKNQMLNSLNDNNEMILKTLNILLLLAGIYVTLLVFIHNPQQTVKLPFLWSEIFSGTFLVLAIFRSIIELFPVKSIPVVYPRELYKLISKKREESLNLIIPTYLQATNEIWLRSEEKNFSRQQIVIFISVYIINFVLFSIYCILRNYDTDLNILSITSVIGIIIFYLWFVNKRRKELCELKNNLEKSKQ